MFENLQETINERTDMQKTRNEQTDMQSTINWQTENCFRTHSQCISNANAHHLSRTAQKEKTIQTI